jgi:hypothetical protein
VDDQDRNPILFFLDHIIPVGIVMIVLGLVLMVLGLIAGLKSWWIGLVCAIAWIPLTLFHYWGRDKSTTRYNEWVERQQRRKGSND